MKLIYALLFLAVSGFANAKFFENEEYSHSFSKRLLYGNQIQPKEAPYMAVVRTVDYNEICSATLITKRLLVSTAKFFYLHYSPVTKMEVLMGFNHIDEIKPNHIYKTKKIHVHESFLPDEEYNNIALIVLTKEINMNSRVRPIPLFLPNDILNQGSVSMQITNYGISNLLNESKNGILRTKSILVNTDIVDLGASLILVGQPYLTKGDSGAPLIFDGKLVGFANYIQEIDETQLFPGIFTGIVHHFEWIGKKLTEIEFHYG